MQRKFTRDNLRKKVGNKNLREAWEMFQKNKYGRFYKEVCYYTQK